MLRKIELAKVRDFGEVINDTFAFLKQNFKPLVKHVLTFSGIFIAGTIICGTMYELQLLNTASSTGQVRTPNIFDVSSSAIYFIVAMALTGIFLALGYFVTTITVLSYLALYRVKGNIPPTTEEMWGYVKYYFWRTFGASLVAGILVIVGFVFCIIPSIYLGVVLALFVPIIIVENGSFNYSFGRCFSLIKDNWWVTFGCFIVMYIIVGIASGITSLPSSLAPVLIVFAHLPANSPIYIVVSAFAMAIKGLSEIFHIIPVITVGLCYFNLVESKEGASLLNKIDAIGTTTAASEPTEDAGEEEY